MTEQQLALVDVAAQPKLTDRQARALEHLQAAGPDGLHADELGAILHEEKPGRWQHGRDARCAYCGSTGTELLKALRKKGLARYRRGTASVPGYWQAAGAADRPAPPVPFGEFPEGF